MTVHRGHDIGSSLCSELRIRVSAHKLAQHARPSAGEGRGEKGGEAEVRRKQRGTGGVSNSCSGQGGSYSTHSPSHSSTAGRKSHLPLPLPLTLESLPEWMAASGAGRRVTARAVGEAGPGGTACTGPSSALRTAPGDTQQQLSCKSSGVRYDPTWCL